MLNHVSRISLTSAALVLGGVPGALALEATEFADRVMEIARHSGVAMSYGSSTLEGDTVTISDFTIAVMGEDDQEIPGAVVFEGVVETPEGGYEATRASIADIEHTDPEDGVTVTLSGVAIENLRLPAEVNPQTMVDIQFTLYERAVAGPFTVTDADGTERFAIDLMEAWVEEPAADGGIGSGYTLEGLRINLAGIEDYHLEGFDDGLEESDEIEGPGADEMIALLGVEQITGSMSGFGIWWPDTGRVDLEDLSFVLDDLGTISMSAVLEGYTRALAEELVEVNLKLAELAESDVEMDEEEWQALNADMEASLADIAIAEASIRYEDNSLFLRVLDAIGAQQGVDGRTMAAGFQFMVPMMLSELDDPELASMVSEAVLAFLNDQQSLEVRIAPDTPLSFGALEELGPETGGDPFALLDRLNLTVTANQ